MISVLKHSVLQNSIKSSRADSRVKVWKFCDVSEIDSVPETLENVHTFMRLSAREDFTAVDGVQQTELPVGQN